MNHSHTGILFSLLFSLALPAFGMAQINLDELAKTLNENEVKGKAGTNLILNRGLTDSLESGQQESSKALAQALGFFDADGSMAPTYLPVPLSTPDWLSTIKKLNQDGKLKNVSVIDIGSPLEALQAGLKASKEKWQNDHAAFRDYLKSMKIDLEAAGLKTIDEAKLVFEGKDSPMVYFSKRFILDKTMEQMRQDQAELVKLQPTLTMGGAYAGNFEQNSDALMLEAWHNKVFTPWVAEQSWQNGEFSPQVLGYYLALARAADSRNPILCDLHVGTGNYPAGIRRSFYLALAQGARGIRCVGAIPPNLAKGKESLGIDQINSWKAIRELSYESSLFATTLANAKLRTPDVAIMVSLTQELWDPSPWVSEERKAIYQAVRMGGHNVKIISEEDIQDGKLGKLATVFVVGNHLQRSTAKVLKNWVSNGAAIACVGGPYLDEYGKPLTDLLEVQGLTSASWQNISTAGPAKITLAQQKPFDTIFWNYMGLKREFPAVYGRLKITQDEKLKDRFFTFGKFSDGSPAVSRNEYEPAKVGQCWVYCAPLGSGWLRTSLLGRKWSVGSSPDSYNHQILLRHLDGDSGDVVASPTGDARWDVITDNLDVETVLLEGTRNNILICINWANTPQKAFLTTQFVPKELTQARSLKSGTLATQRAGLTLSLPKTYTVGVADIVIME
jgi:hypothetical protein